MESGIAAKRPEQKEGKMGRDILVIAPHPDDETLGCGGTLLRHIDEGASVHWLIVTDLHLEKSSTAKNAHKLRRNEVTAVAEKYGFASVHSLKFPTTRLDEIPRRKIVQSIGSVVAKIGPAILYVPFEGDIHSDHRVVFDSTIACTKWFRYPSVKRILAYETPSETDFTMSSTRIGFQPNVFVDITPYLDMKIEIMKHYTGEMGAFPFPRSEKALRAHSSVRGAASGCFAAEAFMLLKEILPS